MTSQSCFQFSPKRSISLHLASMFAAIRKTRIATSELVNARIFLFRAVRNRDPDGGKYNANERAQRKLREIRLSVNVANLNSENSCSRRSDGFNAREMAYRESATPIPRFLRTKRQSRVG